MEKSKRSVIENVPGKVHSPASLAKGFQVADDAENQYSGAPLTGTATEAVPTTTAL